MKEPKKKSDEEAFYDAETLPVRELKILNKKKMKIRKKQEKLMYPSPIWTQKRPLPLF